MNTTSFYSMNMILRSSVTFHVSKASSGVVPLRRPGGGGSGGGSLNTPSVPAPSPATPVPWSAASAAAAAAAETAFLAASPLLSLTLEGDLGNVVKGMLHWLYVSYVVSSSFDFFGSSVSGRATKKVVFWRTVVWNRPGRRRRRRRVVLGAGRS
jgi:hypothetical protein